MVKIYNSTYIYNQAWHNVVNVWWSKYPNSKSCHVQQVDTIHRKLDKESGELITRRLITTKPSNIPSWLSTLGMPSRFHVLEESIIDPKNNKMTIQSINFTGLNMARIQEKCIISQDKLYKNRTEFHKEIKIFASGCNCVFVQNAIENFSYQTAAQSSESGRNLMEYLLDNHNRNFPRNEQLLQWRLRMVKLMMRL